MRHPVLRLGFRPVEAEQRPLSPSPSAARAILQRQSQLPRRFADRRAVAVGLRKEEGETEREECGRTKGGGGLREFARDGLIRQ